MINSAQVESYGGIIASGKEAIVIHCNGGTAEGLFDNYLNQR